MIRAKVFRPASVAIFSSSLFLCAVLSLFPADLFSAITYDPRLKWRTIRSEHFEVHYSQGLEEIARRTGAIAEDVHNELSPKLGWSPRVRTHLVVTDNSDFANGATTVFPYPIITIFLALPSSDDTLDYYDVWLHTLLSHEYTHVLMMDMTGGIPGILRHVFGRSVDMNALVPTWWGEGVPTFEETVNTIQGRGRSPFADMMLRSAILEDRFPEPGRLEEGLMQWPAGDGAYIFGVEFVTYLADRFGEDKVREFLHRYSRDIAPFQMNPTAKRVFGASMSRLWREWEDSLRKKYADQRGRILEPGLIEGKAITDMGFGVQYPVWDPDGRQILFYDFNPHGAPAIYVINPDTGDTERIFKAQAFGPITISPHGRTVAYPRFAPLTGKSSSRFYQCTDIYLQEVKKHKGDKVPGGRASPGGVSSAEPAPPSEPAEWFEGKETRLTQGERASDPDFSPDGEEIIYVSRAPGGAVLKRIGVSTGTRYQVYLKNKPEVLWTPPPNSMLDSPRWSPDGTKIAVSVHLDGGYRDIYLLDLGTGKAQPLTHDRARNVDPAWSPDSRYIVFSSDRNGVPNIYAYDTVNASFAQVTNVLTGAFEPAVSPDQKRLVYQGYTSRGFDLFVMPFDPAKWRPVEFTPKTPAANAYRIPAPLTDASERYRPLATLLPRYLEPNFWYDGVDFQAGLSTGGMDPLQQHVWGATARWGIESNFLSWGATYINNQFKPSIFASIEQYSVSYGKLILSIAKFNQNYQLFYLDKNYFEMRSHGAVGIENLFIYDGIPLQASFSYNLEKRDNITSLPRLVFDKLLPDRGVFSGFELSFTSRSVDEYLYSISPEVGYFARGGIEWNDKTFGSDFNQIIYTADLRGYLPMPWLSHHVLALRAAGGWMEGDQIFQGTFRVGGTLGESIISSPGNKFFALRGFKTNQFIGDRALVVSGEYRFPIANPQSSIGLTPVYFQKIHAALFADYGGAFDRKNRFPLTLNGVPLVDASTGRPISVEFVRKDVWNLGVGAELRVTGFLGWGLLGPAMTGRFGLAQGVQGDDNGLVWYFDIGTTF